MEKDAEGTRALDLLKALRDLPVSLKVLTDTGYDQISMMATMTNDDNVIWAPLAQGEISPCVCFTTHVWEKPNTCLFGFSTRVCKNTHLCSKDHTDGNCVVCGFYHTHVVKTKHAWKSLSLKFKGGFLPRGPSPFLALMIWNPIVILNDFSFATNSSNFFLVVSFL